jgi:hypothetical protein
MAKRIVGWEFRESGVVVVSQDETGERRRHENWELLTPSGITWTPGTTSVGLRPSSEGAE